VIFPLAGLCLYEMMFIRKNDFSRNREYKFLNKPAEMILGRMVSKKVI